MNRAAAGSQRSKVSNGLRRRGFTLIEILAVIGILSVLTALIIPVLGRAKAEARRVQCANNLSQLGKAMQMYLTTYRGTYPVMAARPTLNPGMARLCDTLLPYAPDPRVFQCPSDNQKFFNNEGASYEWNAILNGQVEGGVIESLLGSSRTPMMYDYENFHPDPGNGGFGGKNVVFCDGSVAH